MAEHGTRRLLILSDGKPGHLNQSLALAKHLGRDYDIVPVRFRSSMFKLLSYLFDRFHFYSSGLLHLPEVAGDYCAVVATGSETYYAGKIFARRLRISAVAVMLPKGYRYDFERIIAQEHDRPPLRANILTLPVNLGRVEPQGVFQADRSERYVGIVVGGPNKVFDFDAAAFGQQLDRICKLFPEHRLVAMTSRRTPAAVEAELDKRTFAASFVYSRNPANPLPDLIVACDYLFITVDSTSMISEAVICGTACVELLPLPRRGKAGKYGRLVARLQELGCVHLFAGEPGTADRKIDLAEYLKGVMPCV